MPNTDEITGWLITKLSKLPDPPELDTQENERAKSCDILLKWDGEDLEDDIIASAAKLFSLDEFKCFMALLERTEADNLEYIITFGEKLEESYRLVMACTYLEWRQQAGEQERAYAYLLVEPNIPDQLKTRIGFKVVERLKAGNCSAETRSFVFMLALARYMMGEKPDPAFLLVLNHMVSFELKNNIGYTQTTAKLNFKP